MLSHEREALDPHNSLLAQVVAVTNPKPVIPVANPAIIPPPPAPLVNLATVRSALEYIPADGPREPWLKVAMAIHSATGGSEAGYQIFDTWSAMAGKDIYKGPADTRKVWNSFKTKPGGITVHTVFKMARENGWPGDIDVAAAFSQQQVPSEIIQQPGTHEPFDQLVPDPIGAGLPAEDVNDAIVLLSATFDSRLRVHADRFYWWTGREWEPVTDSAVRRAVGHAAAGGVKVTQRRVRAMVDAMRDHAQRLDEIDPPSQSVYFKNDVLTIAGTLSPHHPDNFNTRTLSVDYDSAATCPQFIDWLTVIFATDPARVQFLQELIGWLLIRHTLGIEKAVLLIGPPRAGKGVIARLIHALLGPAACTFNLDMLDCPKMLSAMSRCIVAIDSDAVGPAPRNARNVMSAYKIITSNESMTIPQLYKQTPMEGPLHCKLFILANSVPTMFDDSSAAANRWVPLTFDQSYLGNEDPHLFKRFTTELQGIAAWSVVGLQRLAARGRFELPSSSTEQLAVMTSEAGSIADFIGERLMLGDGYRVSDAALWNAYQQWAISGGFEIRKRSHVLTSIADATRGNGCHRAKSIRDGSSFYRGFYGLKNAHTVLPTNITPFRILPT